MVRFNGNGRSVDRYRFSNMGINGALRQPFYILYVMDFFIDDLNNSASYDLAFGLRVRNPGQFAQETVPGINPYNIQAHMLIRFKHQGKFILSQEPVIDKNTGQVSTYCLVQQNGGDRTVHSS